MARRKFCGPVAKFLIDDTRRIDLEGAVRSGKTTACLTKILKSCTDHPGIHWLMCRYADEQTRTLLRPLWEQVASEAGVPMSWVGQEHRFVLPNQAWVYCFGIKAQSATERYSKFRGLTLAGIYIDQAEEIEPDLYDELDGRLSQVGMPRQFLISPNPLGEDSWLARRFPRDRRVAGHRYYHLSVYDNAQNLPPDAIRDLELTYPVGHPKHRPMILGLRGLNVIGQPVYGASDPRQPETGCFKRDRHVRPLTLDRQLPLYESLDFGKHHPCVVWAQYTPYAELRVLGGILGQDLDLETFAPIVQQYREQWFEGYLEVRTCCDPAGSHASSQGLPHNAVEYLQQLGFALSYRPDSNSPHIRANMINRLMGAMRRESGRGQPAFGVDGSRTLDGQLAHWVRISPLEVVPFAFVADALEAGYVWDRHMVSVANKQIRKPLKDGWYEHGMNALEYLEHNFGGAQPSPERAERHAERVRTKPDPDVSDDRWRRGYALIHPRRQRGSRGGY